MPYKDPAQQRAYQQEWGTQNHARDRNKKLERRYGITAVQWESIFEAQGGRCAVCRQDRELCTDHCHASGRVRGLLCKNCNTSLGMLEDDPVRIGAMLEYANRR